MHIFTAIVFITTVSTVRFTITYQFYWKTLIINMTFVLIFRTYGDFMMVGMFSVAVMLIVIVGTIKMAITKKTRWNTFDASLAFIMLRWLTIWKIFGKGNTYISSFIIRFFLLKIAFLLVELFSRIGKKKFPKRHLNVESMSNCVPISTLWPNATKKRFFLLFIML